MAYGLTIGTDRSTSLQNAIQDELTKRGYSPDADPVMAEYITIMIINNKTPAQISSELEDLIGSDFDPSFVDWLFAEAAKGAPESETPAPAEPSTSTQTPVRESPPHVSSDASRRPPNGPRSSAPLYQHAISQALPSMSPTAQKRSASARSPSPTGHVNKLRRTDLPTGPRAMYRDGTGSHHGGTRSLLERVGPVQNNQAGYMSDDIQARIDNITSNPDPGMMMMGGGFPMGGMSGMDMAAMANPLMLQEMLMSQMALVSQMAGAMGIMNPAVGQFMNPGFPMQPGMGGDMGLMNGGMNGMHHVGPEGAGRGRRGRGGQPPRGTGRSRGGPPGTTIASPNTSEATVDGPQTAAPPLATSGQQLQIPVVAPTPKPAVSSPSSPATTVPSISNAQAHPRSGFVPPERPQSPTLCKFALKCTNPLCRYSHPSPVATAESGVVLSNEACEEGRNCKDKDCIKAHVSPAVLNAKATEHMRPATFVPPTILASQSQTPCRFGVACTRPGCPYLHPRTVEPKSHFAQPCRFGTACTRATCPFQHPEGRVLPSTFHRGLSTHSPMVNISTPEAGSMSTPSPHKSITFNKSAIGGTAAELEKKVKEMEEKKIQAEKAVAEAEAAAAAGKNDDSSKPVVITA
ncbi:hypothetical protein BKA93DRAFT_812046 [Sparassis latifolia]|uniref:Nab2 type CCCH zinc finger 4 domain-containing protein n=1 Tax=Sparassis crispa TaxID=139825 RepID=A0A401GFZ8_9APHY|nr:hypothetical protein SCP_0307750 [Sparassis crispa]GBE81051.1 hypothetical protein SCP_0307750 [Sparassis crispa]